MKTNQSVAAIARQALAVVGIVFGVLTSSVTALHLPTAMSSILLVAGSALLAVEHYVADPSTGSPAPAPAHPASAPAPVPVAPAPAPPAPAAS